MNLTEANAVRLGALEHLQSGMIYGERVSTEQDNAPSPALRKVNVTGSFFNSGHYSWYTIILRAGWYGHRRPIEHCCPLAAELYRTSSNTNIKCNVDPQPFNNPIQLERCIERLTLSPDT